MSSWMIFWIGVLSLVSIYVMITVSLDLQFSYGNLINLGVAGYVAVGAYTFAILTQGAPLGYDDYRFGFGLPAVVGLVGSVVASLALGAVTAWPALRLRGEYVALTMFAIAEVLRSLLINVTPISNGLLGLTVQRPFVKALTPDGQVLVFTGITLAVAGVVYWLAQSLVKSQFGRVVLAVSDDELGAMAIGKNVSRVRLQVFLLGAGISGLAGGFYAMYVTLIVPSLFVADLSFTVFIALVLGGVRNRLGPITGVVILIGFEQAIQFLNLSPDRAAFISSLRLALTGVLMVIVLKVRPPKNVVATVVRQQSRRSRKAVTSRG